MRSMLSTTTTEFWDLYESLKTLFKWAIFWFSSYPTIESGDISLMKGYSEARAMLAASAVLPEPEGPCNKTETRGVRSELRTCST